MRFDRRITLFFVIAVISFALWPLADEKYQFIPPLVGGAYLVLAALFLLEWLSRRSDSPD
jgi:hypothetical protein